MSSAGSLHNLRTLWIDLTVAVKEGEAPPEFRARCDIDHVCDIERVEDAIAQRKDTTDLVCFEFDYPDRTGLRLLRSTKARHPSLPIVMLTVQHSEALAIWAFRSKVWDYLVKPVAKHDAERCLFGLSRALAQRNSQAPRHATTQPDKIPDEVTYLPSSDQQSLAPAIYYIEKNYRSPIRSEAVAARCDLSPFRFSRLFKEIYGITFRDYLINYRLREAYRLLANPKVVVADVAFAAGFNDPSYFARIFKQRVGVAPSLLIGHADQGSNEELPLELPGLPQQR